VARKGIDGPSQNLVGGNSYSLKRERGAPLALLEGRKASDGEGRGRRVISVLKRIKYSNLAS